MKHEKARELKRSDLGFSERIEPLHKRVAVINKEPLLLQIKFIDFQQLLVRANTYVHARIHNPGRVSN